MAFFSTIQLSQPDALSQYLSLSLESVEPLIVSRLLQLGRLTIHESQPGQLQPRCLLPSTDQNTRTWNEGLIDGLFVEEDAELIKRIPFSRAAKEDSLYWPYSSSGQYTCKSGSEMEFTDVKELLSWLFVEDKSVELFAFTAWMVWNQRNKIRASQNAVPLHLVTEQAKQKLNQFKADWRNPGVMVTDRNVGGSNWLCPQDGPTRSGGLYRNAEGVWVKGYSKVVHAELWVLRDGFILSVQLNIQNLVVKLDASLIVSFMNIVDIANGELVALIDDCRVQLRQIP
nr:hypothetical protein CFP56_50019 [Quercus suber]